MKMKVRHLLCFAALCMLALSTAGCGGGGSTPSTPKKTTPKSSDTSPDDAPSDKPTDDGDTTSTDSTPPTTASKDTGEPWGHLKGRFVYDGTPPAADALQITKDQEVCGKHDLRDESLIVSEGGGLKNVVVFLYLGRGDEAPEAHPSYADAASTAVVLDNLNCRFEPHVAMLQTGQTLLVKNSDPVGHNTKIDTFTNPPMNQTIPAGGMLEHSFDEAERKPMPTSCTIHPWMTAHLLIRDNPYFAVSNENGEFEIKNLPRGDWTFEVWHEKAGNIDSVSIGGQTKAWSRGRVDVSIVGGDNDLGEIKIAPAAFEG